MLNVSFRLVNFKTQVFDFCCTCTCIQVYIFVLKCKASEEYFFV